MLEELSQKELDCIYGGCGDCYRYILVTMSGLFAVVAELVKNRLTDDLCDVWNEKGFNSQEKCQSGLSFAVFYSNVMSIGFGVFSLGMILVPLFFNINKTNKVSLN